MFKNICLNRFCKFSILILFLIILLSCVGSKKTHEDGNKNYSVLFFEKYKIDFLTSSLLHYNYNPRLGFDKIEKTNNDSLVYRYRLLPLKDEGIRIFPFIIDSSDKDDIINNFFIQFMNELEKYEIDSTIHPSILHKTKNDKIQIGIIDNTMILDNSTFEFDIIDYTNKLESLIEKYKILSFTTNYKILKEIHFLDGSHLQYFIDSSKFHVDTSKGHFLDENWFLYNEKEYIDYY